MYFVPKRLEIECDHQLQTIFWCALEILPNGFGNNTEDFLQVEVYQLGLQNDIRLFKSCVKFYPSNFAQPLE